MDSGQRQRLGLVAVGVLVEGGLALLAVVLGWLFDAPASTALHWRADDFFLGIVAALPMLAGFFACVYWPVGPLARIKQFSDEVIRPLFESSSLFELALIAVAAGLGEELLFRGVLQELAGRWLGVAGAVVVVSVVFGLLHAITPTYAVLAALLGAYLACWRLAADSLLPVVVAHAGYDWVALVYLVRARDERA